jgi:hypothetical protein
MKIAKRLETRSRRMEEELEEKEDYYDVAEEDDYVQLKFSNFIDDLVLIFGS